jgi:hypothetical protein
VGHVNRASGAAVLAVAVCLSACAAAPLTNSPRHVNQRPRARALTVVRPTRTSATASTTTTLPPLAVVNVKPRDKARRVGPSAPVVITYNRPPGLAAALPTLSPTTDGQWRRFGTELVFKPTGYWQPATTYRVSVAIRGAKSTTIKFTTRLPSTLALQQYLAILGYIPLRFTPTGEVPNRMAVLEREPTSPNLAAQVQSAGVF